MFGTSIKKKIKADSKSECEDTEQEKVKEKKEEQEKGKVKQLEKKKAEQEKRVEKDRKRLEQTKKKEEQQKKAEQERKKAEQEKKKAQQGKKKAQKGKKKAQQGKKKAQQEKKAEQAKKKAELAKKKAELAKKKAEKEKKRAEKEKKRAEQEKKRAEQEKKRAEQEKKRAEQEKKKAELLSSNSLVIREMMDFDSDIVDIDTRYVQLRLSKFQKQFESLGAQISKTKFLNQLNSENKDTLGSLGNSWERLLDNFDNFVEVATRPFFNKKFPTPRKEPRKCPIQRLDEDVVPTCSNCKTLSLKLEEANYHLKQLKSKLQESSGTVEVDEFICASPKARKVSKAIADMYQMVELLPGSRIYFYQSQLDKVQKRETPTARARLLLLCFYTPDELIAAGNLTGTNEKQGLDKDIIAPIVGFSIQANNISAAAVRASLRNKMTAMASLHKK